MGWDRSEQRLIWSSVSVASMIEHVIPTRPVTHFPRFEKLWWTLNLCLSFCDGQLNEIWLAPIRLVNNFHESVSSGCSATLCLDHKSWLRNRCHTDCPSQTLFLKVLSITFYITDSAPYLHISTPIIFPENRPIHAKIIIHIVKINSDFLLVRTYWVAIRGLLQSRVKVPAETAFRHRTFHKYMGQFLCIAFILDQSGFWGFNQL